MISRGRGGRAGGSAVARAWRVAVLTGSVAAAAGAVHAAVNGRLLRRPVADPPGCRAAVSVLLPVRDEAHRLEPCLRSLLGQVGLARMELLVLDDGSTDGTAALARRIIAGSPRARLLTGRPPPAGWLGKPHACGGQDVAATRRPRRRAAYQAIPTMAAPTPTAVPATTGRAGVRRPANRLCSDTGRLNVSTGQPRCTASRRSARSGFTAVGWPTASSIGTSVAESL
jgi:hypothetical protein